MHAVNHRPVLPNGRKPIGARGDDRGLRGRAKVWLTPVMVMPFMIWLGFENFLLFHTSAELFSCMVGVVLFFVATQTFRFTNNGFLAVLGIIYLWAAVLVGLHALHYPGMGVFPAAGANQAIQYGLATRLVEAGGILFATQFIGRSTTLRIPMIWGGTVSLIIAIFIETNNFPEVFVEGHGLTSFKILSEWGVISLLALAGWQVWRKRTQIDRSLVTGLLTALVLTAAAELCFALYSDVYGLLNMIGHLLSILSFWVLLDATVGLTLTRPFRQLAQDTAAFDHISQPALIFDRDDQVAHANQAFATPTGCPRQELIGWPVKDALSTHFRTSIPPSLDTLLAVGETAKQVTIRVGDKEYDVDLTYHDHAELGQAGSLLLVDRTRRAAAERDLENERWRAQQALDNSEQGLWDWDIQTGAVLYSDGIMTMLGDPPGSWLPNEHAWDQRLHPADQDAVNAILQAHLDGETDVYVTEYRLRHADGSYIWVLDKGRVVERAEDGRPLRIIGTHANITDRKRLEQELASALEEAQAASRAKSDFLASMSHELRTPLNAIIGFSEIMSAQAMGPVGTPRYLDYAKDIRGAGGDLLALIDDVLDLSKIEAGRMDLLESDIDLARVIGGVARLVQGTAQGNSVSLTFKAPDSLPYLLGDRRMVKQILLNLLSNAVKFTPEGGSISVEAELGLESEISICVNDTGIGMQPKDIQRAMEPFAQVGNALVSQPGKGTGLGLSLVKRMMDLHGGRLAIESAPGKGTKVHLTFPPSRTGAARR